MRVGIGYDVHKLIEGRSLILGGVNIPFEKGLLGHSDSDVLVHSIMDALLGACGERDIGVHFPPEDIKFKGISSLILLEKVRQIVELKGYSIINVDCIIIAEKPKLMGYIPKMEENIAQTLKMKMENINVKATTTEGLGFEGRGEGISTQAIVMLSRSGEA